ncbi:MAG: hypothetical protein Q4E28_05085 [Clostridia bacterium]|nr:hypothetical protein [Clostridia bacterium]
MKDKNTLTQDTQTTSESNNEETKVGNEATEKKTSFSQADMDNLASLDIFDKMTPGQIVDYCIAYNNIYVETIEDVNIKAGQQEFDSF